MRSDKEIVVAHLLVIVCRKLSALLGTVMHRVLVCKPVLIRVLGQGSLRPKRRVPVQRVSFVLLGVHTREVVDCLVGRVHLDNS